MLLAVAESVDVPALIRARLPELSPNDRRIAAWLLEHEAEAPFQTAESLARGAGVSKAAVVRFGSRLGFGGYAGLSDAMAGAASQRLARQGGGGRAAPHGSLLDRWLSACLGDLEATRNAISDVLLDRVATLLLAGDGRTYVFGQRKSASLAEYAFFLLSPLVPNVQLIASGTASLADLLLDVHAGDRLLVLTFRPYARLAGEVIEFFRQAGGSIILISDDVGTDAGGQGTRDIVTEVIAADTVLYNLKIPGYNPPGTLLHSAMTPGLVNIGKVMEATGGELFDVRNVANLDAAFSALIQRIKTRYTLGYYTMATGGEGKPHKLDVRLASSFGKKGRDYTILSKNGYYIH